jgi:lipoyl(octanoyl) transferase
LALEFAQADAEQTAAARLRPAAWAVSRTLVPYETASVLMARRVDAIVAGAAPELVWSLEHPALYTAGTSAKPADLLQPHRLPVYPAGRGGQFTYHGPGQRVCYLMLDVTRRFGDVRAFVASLEDWIIAALADLGVSAHTRPGMIGVWVRGEGGEEEKIAALGVRLRRWVSSHGISLNVAPDLSHYVGIVPCGLSDGVTSLAKLGCDASLHEVDVALRRAFERTLGPTQDASPPETP